MPRLRPFQEKLVHDVYTEWQAGARNVLMVAPTGSGKTVVTAKLLSDNVGASCAIAHRQELVAQISTALARNGLRHGIIAPKAVRKNIGALHVADDDIKYNYVDPNARCRVAGVDTLVRADTSDPWFNAVSLWAQDEAHHVLRVNKWGKAVDLFPNARGVGPTATPGRADGCGLGRHADGVFDTMVLAPSMRDLINMGYLTDYRIISQPVADLNLNNLEISATTGDFNESQMREAMHKSQMIVGDVVGHYRKWAPGKLGVTFAADVAHATEIAIAFKSNGVPAEVVSAKTDDSVRAEILRRFKRREILQLVNVDLFGEGFDLPAIEVVSFARPTQSFSLYSQQFGRVLRLMLDPTLAAIWDTLSDTDRVTCLAHGSKPHGMIIDHVGNVIRHNGPPDRARDWSLDRRERRARGRPLDVIPYRNCLNPVCMKPYERIYACCPYCGTRPVIADRSAPEYVDGDLIELDPATLAALRGEIMRIDGPPNISSYGSPAVAGSIKRTHWERQQAQGALRNAMSWWSGLQNAQGRRNLDEQYRRFYFSYGVDVATAETLPAKEATELRDKIAAHLAQFNIDATVPGGIPAFTYEA